ncbi:MAG: UDP-N-acetylglucosamine--N-acetylmuramyl-(pentapeptide) pyrophosphoryl-undecaprenol N-acetylglucosamine transferase [Phycisphaerae bacterium]|nr:UDP-N-acetylglucosamine--N-acetylmuramyl-(pentapeptide) pyrophosphoryl-undecaprenol N-acetylglucosamine transferase [Phycisphaerae bacterium]MDD5380637.1 UDP-N-acetylglucosamine--N-acetylmuramyl-(pentapeptide) pyrophosphoryl-undecaprenol N-acetylglucosamine transferase [Phycisphaerae bacterium]
MAKERGRIMGERCFFFAGGGTGGHIYPALAIAERIIALEPKAKIHFFCSSRDIDSQILSETSFEFTALPACGFSIRPSKLVSFCTSFLDSFKIAKRAFIENENTVVIGIGGFVSAPVCLAAHRLKIPVVLVNVDITPGRSNKAIARWADKIFVQFEDTKRCFGKNAAKVDVVGCPLRSGFDNPQPEKTIEQLGLEKGKKILLITGASSGSENINQAVSSLLGNLAGFAGDWQIVHLAGRANFKKVQERYVGAKTAAKVVDYFDDMPDLLSAADLVVGRSGAVSVAEYAAAGVPSICIPYPYHKDRHQYLNAGKLVDVGAAVIVDDVPQREDMTRRLWAELEELMKDGEKRKQMAERCKAVANKHAASQIAEKLLQTNVG